MINKFSVAKREANRVDFTLRVWFTRGSYVTLFLVRQFQRKIVSKTLKSLKYILINLKTANSGAKVSRKS